MIRIFRHYISPRKALFIIGEGALIFFAVSIGTYLVLGRWIDFGQMLHGQWQKIFLVTIVTQMSLYFNDLYEFKRDESWIDAYSLLLRSIGITSIALSVIYFIWPRAMIGRWIFFVSIIFLILFLVSWRILYNLTIKRHLLSEKAILVGDGELAKRLVSETKHQRDFSYDIRAIVGHENGRDPQSQIENIPVRYGFDNLCDSAIACGISSIIVALDERRGIMPYNELLKCKVRGLSVIDGESFYERITGKLLAEKINPSGLVFSEGFKKSRTIKILKRIFDLSMASTMLVLLSPLMVLVAIVIKLESTGPVMFSQERMGEFGDVFILHKFRSMKIDAEKDTGPVWATEQDPRITRIGRIIRKLRIDELPQLWNVFKGEMSFVGPRPERPFFVELLKEKIPYYNERFTVKPGVTGWAQVKYPYGANEEAALEKLKYELYYIKNMSLAMDMAVIFHTVKIVLLGRGGR